MDNFSSVFQNPNYTSYNNSITLYENFDAGNLYAIGNSYVKNLRTINSTYGDISNNITGALNTRSDLSGNKQYDYNTPFTMEKPKTLLDGMIYDNNLLSVQENAMYVLGTISAATLIIFAIALGRENNQE
jgi:hypothetical protein